MNTARPAFSLASLRHRLRDLGPGLITGAADDDPSGIATYSQAGAKFGYALLWTLVLALPLMAAIQIVSARIGYVTRRGLMANVKANFPRGVALAIAGGLVFANTINIAADLAAMGEALRLIVGGSAQVYAVIFGLVALLLQVFLPYARYVRWLKWLTLSLLAYVGLVLFLQLDWLQVLLGALTPKLPAGAKLRDAIVIVVAVFGTTISPYLFFWQASQEVEETRRQKRSAADVRRRLRRIKVDTIVGMTFSNAVAFCIMVSTAATLHVAGITDIETSAQAAEALRPLAGELTFLLFGLGIIGTGLLAVPVLAGSAAYAVAEMAGWSGSLNMHLTTDGRKAWRFYGVIAAATLGGVAVGFLPIDPVRALLWAAVTNGVFAVPIMALMMLIATNRRAMNGHAIGPRLRWLGWCTTTVMAAIVIAMFATL